MKNSKKHQQLESVNRTALDELKRLPATVMVVRVEEAEMDEMWGFVQSKRQQCWLWHAIDHHTGTILAYLWAPHEDVALSELMQLLTPFGTFLTKKLPVI